MGNAALAAVYQAKATRISRVGQQQKSTQKMDSVSHLTQENRFQCGIQFRVDVFQQTGLSEAYSILQSAQKIPVRHLHHLNAVLFLLQHQEQTPVESYVHTRAHFIIYTFTTRFVS